MKNRNKILLLISSILILFMISCYIPNPLYGTWADSIGNKIIFNDDWSFNATIVSTDDTTIEYNGNWSLVDNILILDVTSETSSYKRIVEWDLSGAILHIIWTTNNQQKNLTLYHTAR